MMTEAAGTAPQGRKAYPYIPNSNWWELRRKFQQAPPRGVVDSSFLASLLDITEPAAANLVGPLRAVGLIDEANRATDRALAWRDDDQYRQVTLEMIESVYPQALLDIASPPDPDRDKVEKWFARTTGKGEAAVGRMARFYLLLAAGDPSGAEQPERPVPPTRRPVAKSPAEHPAATHRNQVGEGQPAAPTTGPVRDPLVREERLSHARTPDVHIDIQVHIDPAATADQIDQIFASMARHLYGKE